jgi:hypothetical protein
VRDPKRIIRICQLFQALWLAMPDMRFFQMISYVKSKFPDDVKSRYTKNIHGDYAGDNSFDPFNVEDDLTEQTLRDIARSL